MYEGRRKGRKTTGEGEDKKSEAEHRNSTQIFRAEIHGRYNVEHDKGCKKGEDWSIFQDMNPLNNIIIVPRQDRIFQMFERLPFKNIKVVIIGQDPYPGKCIATNTYYACGPAFDIPSNVLTCPVSLKNIFSELKREYGLQEKVSMKYIKSTVSSWINQGVFLTNVALTRGISGTYLDDHKAFWMQFTISFVKNISALNCPIVLLGSDAWKLADHIVSSSPVLKFSHPASRNKEFEDCKMFTKINNELECPINWILEK